VNKNGIPFDTQSPFVTSGIRLGTAAMTTRGFKEAEMKQVAKWIGEVLRAPEDAAVLEKVRGEVTELTKGFPVP
jgi:glycine hydroxymethyltransferase